ncbi:MAG: hypothetical protein PHU25_19885 [Deltaproteobacteria bacterium]|nr:hypothetical protein [Deltaproteobacteria bacterium]
MDAAFKQAVRFGVINVVGRVVNHARRLIVKLSGRCETVGEIIARFGD